MLDSFQIEKTVGPAARGRLTLLYALLCLLPALGACNAKKIEFGDTTGGIARGAPEPPRDATAQRQFAEDWGRRYDANPQDRATAITYARALHALNQNAQAVAVLQGLAIQYPEDMKVLAAYGKSLADAGELRQAAEVLSRAHTPDRPDWTVLSAQGSVADQMGDHETARGYYEAALKIRPDEPTVLSNLGLSHALSRQLPKAEATLRQAAEQPGADARVRQNYALVLGLRGKFAEAEAVAQRDLSTTDAAANISSIRQMIAQSDTWREIQTAEATPTQSMSKK
jgi:Flp pilus assembly protein TadD